MICWIEAELLTVCWMKVILFMSLMGMHLFKKKSSEIYNLCIEKYKTYMYV